MKPANYVHPLWADAAIWLLISLIGHGIYNEMQPEKIEAPPLWYKDGVWHTDGTDAMNNRAAAICKVGEKVIFPEGSTLTVSHWTNGGKIQPARPLEVYENKWTVPPEKTVSP